MSKLRSTRQLSRIPITGHIHEHTPLCVLIEIADAHGIKYDANDHERPNFAHHLIRSIQQTSIPSIGKSDEISFEQGSPNEIKDLSEWQFIARFVNKHSKWPQGKLVQAYNFLIGFINHEDPLSKIPIDFTSGLQTPSNPFNINACILYKIGIHHRLHMTSRTTIEQMAYVVRMLREPLESVIRRSRSFIERDAHRTDLINILMLSPYEIQDPDPPMPSTPISNYDLVPVSNASYEMLECIHGSLQDLRILQQKIDPTTDSGAIALAAINYNIDLSRANEPLREYRLLRIAGLTDYKPVDPWMEYWYQRNPALFDLRVMFNPVFPPNFYDPHVLEGMGRNNGFTDAEIANAPIYELLQVAYVTENFYNGEMPNMKSKQTPISLDPIEEIPYGELLCYGQLDSPLQPISVSELIDLFDANQNFTNPFNNGVFTSTALNKLKILVRTPVTLIPGKRLSETTIANRDRLISTIGMVESLLRSNDEPTRQFAFTYRNASPDTKDAIIKALNNLLHAGMYMRGWNGPGHEFPVVRAPVPSEREPEVAVNVTKAIADFECAYRSLGRIGSQLIALPLVQCRDGQYQVSNSDRDGRTIGERINIVKEGESISNMASCIRLSSNWLCASAHKYLTALGQPAPFDIFHLRYIA